MSAVRLFAALAAVFVASPALAGSITISSTPTTGGSFVNGTFLCSGSAACNLSATELSTQLTSGAVTVTAAGSGADISVNESVTWSGTVLTLSAAGTVRMGAAPAVLSHSGAGSGLTLRGDAECAGSGGVSLRANSISGNTNAYVRDPYVDQSPMVSGQLTVWNLLNSTADIAGMGSSGNYALGCDVSGTVSGFASVPFFAGKLDGLGHAVVDLLVSGGNGMFTELRQNAVVTNLVLVRPRVISTADAVGALAGSATRATISRVAVLAGSVEGRKGTGGLVGTVSAGDISEIYVSGTVTGADDTGGVVGSLDAIGLLLGDDAVMSNVMSKAKVSGANNVGGLVGAQGTHSAVLGGISHTLSWSAGQVSGTSGVGGAVGAGGGSSNVYWDRESSRVPTSASGTTGLTTAESKKRTSYAAAFGLPLGTVWMIREDVSRPFLRSMQSLLDSIVAVNGTGSTLATQTAPFVATVTLPAGTANYEAGGNTAPVTGPIRFLDGSTLIDSTSLANGSATVSTATLTVGEHSINVIYDGNDYHVENSSSVGHTVLKASTSIAIADASGPINATVTPLPPATGVPSGSVTFNVDDGRSFVVPMASGIATLSPSQLGAGDFVVTATYPGDAFFDGSGPTAGLAVHIVGPTETTLGQSIAISQLGESFDLSAIVTNEDATPTGTVRFVADNVTLLAETTLSAGVAAASISTLTGGTHVIVAQYIPANTEEFTASVSPQITHEITRADTNTNIIVADIHDGYVTLNVEVTRPNELLPAATGDVTITIDGVDVGDPTLVDGMVAFDSEQLPRGTHTVSARYDGDGNYNASTSSELEVTVELEGFRFVATPRKGMTFAGGSVPVTLQLTPENGTFAEQVTFSCENLPPGATCSFSPVAVNVAPAGTTVGLLINTQRAVAAAGLTLPRVPPVYVVPFVALAAGLYVLTRRRKVAYLALALTAFACGSSGGDGDPTEGTPPGTYAITVKAQGQTITRTTTVEVEVR